MRVRHRYPQAIRDPGEVKDYVEAVKVLDPTPTRWCTGSTPRSSISEYQERVAKRRK